MKNSTFNFPINNSNYIVLATVYITDRQGFIEDEIDLKKSNGSILSLEWDKDGLYLAILQEGNNILFLWHSTKKILSEIDIGYKDVSILSWSKTGPQLAVCTLKGNLFLYNKETKKNLSIMGKHSKKISSGRWSTEGNYLALGSDDNMVSISTENGDTVLETDVRFTPIESSFVSLTNGPENGLACNLDGKLLFLFYFKNEKEAPIELAFGCDDGDTNSNSKCKYGIIRHHESINSTLVLVGFSLGYLLTVAISGDELGQEQCVGRFFTTNLITFAFNPASEVVAVAGDDGIRFVDISDLKERSSEYISSEQIEYGKIQHLAWSPNGQMLTVSSSAGNVYCFLAKSNSLFCSYKSKVAYLSSFQEVTLIDSTMVTSKQDQKIIPLSMEPEHLSIGENYLTTSTGNKLCVYSLSSDTDTSNDSPLIMEQEFNADITDIQSNKTHLAALTSDAKVSILSIDSGSDGPRSSNKSNHIAIPDKNNNHDDHHSLSTDIQITCMAITKAHLYFGTDSGTVQIFALDEWILVPGIKLQLESAVTGVYPNLIGTRAVVASSDGSVYLFSPVSAPTTIQLASAPTTVVSVLWDLLRKDVFMIYDGENIHTYMYVSSSYRGSYVVKLGPVTISIEGGVLMEPSKFKLSTGYRPLTTRSGRITCITSSGSLTEVIHPYFDQLGPDSKLERERLSRLDPDDKDDQTTILRWFAQAIGLLCLESAWESALMLRRRELWLALSGKAVETLNIDLAIRVYRQLLDAGMVMSLQSIASVEDRLLLSGHISLLFNDHDRAQELFLQSSDPSAALRLRCDLLQWEEAYKIAKALASTQLCDVTARYALQLEQQAEYESALKLFESCLEPQTLHGKHLPASVGTVRESVESGLCRCELRLGNLRKGIKLAYELNVTSLFQECGDILEQQKQYSEAADLHLKAMDFERAAFIYTKNIARSDPSRIKEAAAVLAKVSNDQLNIAFAKLCIIAGDYVEAMHAYSRANDFEKVCNLR